MAKTQQHRRRPGSSALFTAAAALLSSHGSGAHALKLWGSGGDDTVSDAAALATSATSSGGGSVPSTSDAAAPHDDVEYGVDVSFPIHHTSIEPASSNPLGDRAGWYENDFMKGCRERYPNPKGRPGRNVCDQTEIDRVAMSLRQPSSMQNYTGVGYKKIRAPEAVFKLLKQFWDDNHEKQDPEAWPKGNTYTNHWVAPTKMVSVENRGLRGGGTKLKQAVWNAAKDTIQEWTQEELTQCSLYGIRVYKEGAVLATHVDRLPLVSSAIINVAQDVDEPWPIEVYGHDGKATNVTMEPGDMVLYESHSVLHGRPFPLKGRFYANLFIHFEPTGHSLRHNAKAEAGDDTDVHEKYRRAAEKGQGGHETAHSGLPSYIKEGTQEATKWFREHTERGDRMSRPKSFATGSTTTVAHKLAQKGDANKLGKVLDNAKHLVHAEDENGWTPLVEGSRGGHKDVVELLVQKGAQVNHRTNGGSGGTALWWAVEEHGEAHSVVDFLKSVGALNIGPEL